MRDGGITCFIPHRSVTDRMRDAYGGRIEHNRLHALFSIERKALNLRLKILSMPHSRHSSHQQADSRKSYLNVELVQ